MTLDILLLLLRLFGAACLLGFLGLMAWLMMRDLQVTSGVVQRQGQLAGFLQVVAVDMAVDTAVENTKADVVAVDTRFPLLPVTSIGRSPSNVIVLDDGYISTEHALIMRRDGKWWVEDLHSRNGTLLNEVPLTGTAVVSTGDVVKVGSVALRLELKGEEVSRDEPASA